MQKAYLLNLIAIVLLCTVPTSHAMKNLFGTNKKHKTTPQQVSQSTTTTTTPTLLAPPSDTQNLKKELENTFNNFLSASKDFENIQPTFFLNETILGAFITLCTTTKNLNEKKLPSLASTLYNWALISNYPYKKIEELIKTNPTSTFETALKIIIDDALRTAVENNDLVSADYALKAGADAKQKIDTYGSSLVHLAAYCGFIEQLTRLVQETGYIPTKNSRGETALHLAAEQNQLNSIKTLVKNGWDPSELDYQGKRARDLASDPTVIQYLRMAESLKAAKLYPEFAEQELSDFIKLAAELGSSGEMVMTLLSNWAIEGSQPIKKFEAINLGIGLLQNGDSKEKVVIALQAAIDTLFLQTNSLDKIKSLIASGASLSTKNKSGENRLHRELCRSQPDTEIIKYLITSGINVNEPTSNTGKTPLHLVTEVTHAELLLKNGANLSLTDSTGNTPLHTAILAYNSQLVALYLRYGAETNRQNNQGNTPLHLAHSIESKTILEQLLGQKPDVTIKNDAGKTALEPINNNDSTDHYCTTCREFATIATNQDKNNFNLRMFAATKILSTKNIFELQSGIDPFIFFGNKKHLEWLYNWAHDKNILSSIITSEKNENGDDDIVPDTTRSWMSACLFAIALKRYSINAPMLQDIWEEALTADKNIKKNGELEKHQKFFNDIIKRYPPAKPLQKALMVDKPYQTTTINQN